MAISAGGLGLDYRVDQIVHSVANGLPLLQRYFEAVLPRRKAAKMCPGNFKVTLRVMRI